MTAIKSESQLDMEFAQPVLETPTREIRGMVRGGDSLESQRGAVDQLTTRTRLQHRILAILAEEGPLTDRELETRTEFRGYGPSSVRKRRSECFHDGRVVKVGRRDKMSLWDIAPTPE